MPETAAKNTAGKIENQQEFQLTNRQLLVPYLAPYVAYVGIGALLGRVLSIEWIYAARILFVMPLLVWAWQWYVPITGPKNKSVSIGVGAVAGLAGCAGWVFFMRIFAEAESGDPWSETEFFLRLAAASLLVPIFEEYLMRGYVFRLALQWNRARRARLADPFGTAYDSDNIGTVEPGAWSVAAVAISALVFAAGHSVTAWVASIFYGILMCGLWIFRKDLLSCMVTHGVTNFSLACYVKATGQWGLW